MTLRNRASHRSGTSFSKRPQLHGPPAKHQLTFRLDADMLDWLKTNGRGYQTRINRILRAAMESQPPRRARSTTLVPKKSARTRASRRV